MTPEEIGQLLDQLGQRLGPAGEYVWQLTVKQIYIDSIIGLIFGSILLTIGIISALLTFKYWEDESITDDKAGAIFAGDFLGIVGLLFVAMNIPRLLNPEFHAMMKLLEAVIPE